MSKARSLIKARVTRKAVKAQFETIIELAYCECPNLLTAAYPAAYTAGIYGWNADIIVVDCNTCIVTGCRPFGNIHPSYDMAKRYEERAKEIKRNFRDWTMAKDALDALVEEFASACEMGDIW